MTDPLSPTTSRPHRAAVAEDWTYRVLGRLLTRRGWVVRVEPYAGYGGPGWVRIMARTLLAPPGTRASQSAERDAASAQRAVRGWRSFFTAQVAGAVVEVEVGGRTHRVTSDRGGYVDQVVEADLEPGWHDVTLLLGGQRITAPVLVVAPETRTALVSDIDDTVMITALPRPLLAAWNGLVLHESARRVVHGMAPLYQRWQAENPGAPTFYLSTGAWNIAPALRRFLGSHGFPAGPLLLTDWGPTNTGWFRSGRQHKLDSLRRLMSELPQIHWVLVGDDGQHDPQIYADIATEHPDRVSVIAIRQLTPAEQLLAHGTPAPSQDESVAERGPTPVVVHGADGNALALALIDAGVLHPDRAGRVVPED
ncbi:MAG TPA: phosphatase domain-containing protein [Actinotalea sp.]